MMMMIDFLILKYGSSRSLFESYDRCLVFYIVRKCSS